MARPVSVRSSILLGRSVYGPHRDLVHLSYRHDLNAIWSCVPGEVVAGFRGWIAQNALGWSAEEIARRPDVVPWDEAVRGIDADSAETRCRPPD